MEFAGKTRWSVSILCFVMFGTARAEHRPTRTPPPKDAVVLFGGSEKDLAKWSRRNGQPATWKVTDGALVAADWDILTRQTFGDHQLHLEFWIPPRPKPDTEGNGNSGLYLHGFYEIQIIDSAGRKPHKGESCGAIYGQFAPREDTALPAGAWQSLDAYFHAPRVSAAGKVEAPARITVYLNGGRIHDNVEAQPTPGSLPAEQFKSVGPVLLQYHGYAVRFREIWVRPLVESPAPGSSPRKTMTLDLPGGVKVEFVHIPAGKFQMGSSEDTLDRGIDEKQHEVTLTKGFWLGKWELMNRQFRAFRSGHVSHGFADFEKGDYNADDKPVVAVALADAQAFCDWASQKTGRKVRLPTEAEWEYACRAGSTGRYCFGDDPALLGDYAWYAGNSGRVTHSVGRKKPNAWGLYDMHGNVAEWVSDWYTYYPGGPQVDPKGPPSAGDHAWHECSWSSKPFECRCSQRDRAAPDYKSAALGFRVACDE